MTLWFDLARDVRHSVRALWLVPGFALAIIVTLALGIGANSAAFTIVNAVLFRPLPFPGSERVVSVSRSENGIDRGYLDDGTYRALASGEVPGFQSVAASRAGQMVLTLPGGRTPVGAISVSAQYFDVYGMRPVRGRAFTVEEDRVDAPDVVVLSAELWRSAFGVNEAIVGQSIMLDDRPHLVLGIVPEVPISIRGAQLWTPLRLPPPQRALTSFLIVSARMQPNATLESVRAEINAVGRRLDQERPAYASQRQLAWTVVTQHERLYGDSRRPLMLLWGAVIILLLIACANVAHLALARAARREREFCVRQALGASRFRIIRMALIESFVLSFAGAALGVAIAWPAVGYLSRSSPSVVSTAAGVRIDATVLGFTVAIAIGTAVAFGLVPALRATGAGARLTSMSGSPRATNSRAVLRLRMTLIVAQLSTALVLLTAASIVTKTLVRVATIDLGFSADRLYAVRPALAQNQTRATAAALFDELSRRFRRDPGVLDVAWSDVTPLSNGRTSRSLTNADRSTTSVDVVTIDTGYFRTVGARIIEGRAFTSEDRRGAPEVVVINETLSEMLFAGRSAIGQPLHPHDQRIVVGVVRDIRQRGLEAPVAAIAYSNAAQTDHGYGFLLVRAARGTLDFAERARRIMRAVDPNLPPPAVTAIASRRDQAIAPRRFAAVLATVFAALALLLAAVGLFGALMYFVNERTRDIGIRVALGADPARVLRSILARGLGLTAVGVAIGAVAAGLTVRLLRGLVYDMSVYDPWMFSTSVALLALVAIVATWVPARRAAATDPVKALRIE